MITVLPEGGLCNRMRVVASAWLLAQAVSQPMRVLWYQTPDFNAPFSRLFESDSLPFSVEEKKAMSRLARAGFRLREWWARLNGKVVLGARATEPGVFDLIKTVASIAGRDVFVRTNSRLVVKAGMYALFVPTPEIRRLLDDLPGLRDNCIGVHVRRTDNTQAARISTLDSFVLQMRAELKCNSECRFFLATDSPKVKQQLSREFGNKVWEYRKRAYDRSDPQAIVDAVVDLYALGRCRKLIGSYWSSFTDTAIELNDIPFVIARAKGD
jgi:hypothetical protein